MMNGKSIKRIVAFFTAIVCIIAGVQWDELVTHASVYENFEYKQIDGGVSITGYTGKDKIVIVPGEINGLQVLVIEDSAFFSCEGITEMIISEGITTICDWAFKYCSNLEKITLPNTVTTVGEGAFAECSSLIEITLPDSVVSMGVSTFENCTSLEKAKLSSGASEIPNAMFKKCTSLKEVIIPKGITTISDKAFYNCTALEEVALPEGLTDIGHQAFRYCYDISKVTMQTGVIKIGDYAFSYCSSLKEIILPDSVTSIGKCAFFGCEKMTKATLPDNIAEIPYGMFEDCERLREIIIPDSVTTIGGLAFRGCQSLTDIIIPENVKEIESSTFERCALKTVAIPDGVTTIEAYAFQECSKLEEVFFPDSVTTIGERAFYDCSSLKEIILPDSVTSIGEYAFCYCSSLGKIVLSPNAKEVPKGLLYECNSLETVIIPDGIERIEYNSFPSNPENLSEIIIPDSVTAISPYWINNFNFKLKVYGMEGSYAQEFAKEKGYSFEVPLTVVSEAIEDKVAVTVYLKSGCFENAFDFRIFFEGGTLKESDVVWSEEFVAQYMEQNGVATKNIVTENYSCVTITGEKLDGSAYSGPICTVYFKPEYKIMYYQIGTNTRYYTNIFTMTTLYGWQQVERENKIEFCVEGEVVDTQWMEDGEAAVAPVDPTKAEDEKNTYVFVGWDKALDNVTDDMVVNAVFETKVKNKVTFVAEGKVIDTQWIKDGDAAIAPVDPVKKESAKNTYVFTGWDKSFNNVTEDMVINAVFEAKPKNVVEFCVEGKIINTQWIKDGEAAVAPADPTKAEDVQNTYIFTGWDKSFDNVTEDMVINAVFEVKLKNKVEFCVEGKVVDTQWVKDGEAATAPENVTKAEDNMYYYEFTGWDKATHKVTEDMMINAVFATKEKHKVEFVVDNVVVDTQWLKDGEAAIAPADPTKEADEKYTYTFTGWDKTFDNVTGDLVINAAFKATEIPPKYKLGDVNDDGIINAQDALLVLQRAANGVELTETQTLAADIQTDGVINAADALVILQIAAGII